MPTSPQSIPRRVYRRARERRAAREESRFEPALRSDPQAPELLLSPHWDDAVLDCWSLLSGPGALNVVNVFAGVPGEGKLTLWDATTGASDSAARARERIAEDASALALAGREPLSLPFLDAQYRPPPQPTLEAIDREISRGVPAASRVYVPAGIGSHPDHLLTRRYGRMLLRAGMPVSLYADVPYCVMHGWPEWVDGRERDPHRNIDVYWRSYLDQVPELADIRSAHVTSLDRDTASVKLSAMRTYATQYACLSYGARGLLDDPAIHGFEVRWDLSQDGTGTVAPSAGSPA
jgi:LmbE family N-acetylglucosaminyl deacetylase